MNQKLSGFVKSDFVIKKPKSGRLNTEHRKLTKLGYFHNSLHELRDSKAEKSKK